MIINSPINFDDSFYDDTISGISYALACNKRYKPTMYDLSYDKIINYNDIWFMHRNFIVEFFKGLPVNCPPIKIVTQHSDYELDDYIMSLKPDCVKKIYAPNNTCLSSDSIPIPLGLGPKFGRGAPLQEDIKNKNTKQKRDKLLYINFRTYTYPSERVPLWDYYYNNKFSWTTVGNISNDYDKFDTYLDELISHKFSLCPRGNGIDTHRLWESLYCRTIPVVRYEIGYRNFTDLPILFVDNWDQISEDFLLKKYDEMCNKKWDFSKLKCSWWVNQIKNSL